MTHVAAMLSSQGPDGAVAATVQQLKLELLADVVVGALAALALADIGAGSRLLPLCPRGQIRTGARNAADSDQSMY